MARKSAIKKLPDDQRSYIEKLLREDRCTLDEMLDAIRRQFPTATTPSRSSLGRYKQSFEEMAGRMRDIQAASRVLVEEFGEDVDDRVGALLTQAVTTLATNVALESQDTEVSIKEVGEMARAARAVMQARTMSMKERQAIEQAARDRLLREQEQRLEEVRGADGMSEQLEARIRGILLGKT